VLKEARFALLAGSGGRPRFERGEFPCLAVLAIAKSFSIFRQRYHWQKLIASTIGPI
jgi:hypothetical protein